MTNSLDNFFLDADGNPIELPQDTGQRHCRQCGCTDAQACMTDDGPCHWVEPDLCSGCAGKEGGQ